MNQEKVNICGLFVDRITFEDTLDALWRAVEGRRSASLGKPLVVFTANLDMLAKAERDVDFQSMLNSADILTADGMPLLWTARLLGTPLPERVTGSDLVPMLATQAAARGFSLFLLGSAPGVAARAAEILRERNPKLTVAGTLSPPLGFENDESELARIGDAISAAAPDVVLVGLGAPKQERWILAHGLTLPVAALVAVGGTFDLIAEGKRRAPKFFQRTGIEWVWRMAQEPGRLGHRYLIEDRPALAMLIREAWRRRGSRVKR